MIFTLDDYFHAATTVALEATSAPFVWLVMAFAAVIALIVFFATCCLLFYNADDVVGQHEVTSRVQLEIATRGRTNTTTKDTITNNPKATSLPIS